MEALRLALWCTPCKTHVVNLPTKSINQGKYQRFTQYFDFVKSKIPAVDKGISKHKRITWWYYTKSQRPQRRERIHIPNSRPDSVHYTKENKTVSSHTIIYVHVYVVKLQKLSFKENDTLRMFTLVLLLL